MAKTHSRTNACFKVLCSQIPQLEIGSTWTKKCRKTCYYVTKSSKQQILGKPTELLTCLPTLEKASVAPRVATITWFGTGIAPDAQISFKVCYDVQKRLTHIHNH